MNPTRAGRELFRRNSDRRFDRLCKTASVAEDDRSGDPHQLKFAFLDSNAIEEARPCV